MKQKLLTIGLLALFGLSLNGQNFVSPNNKWNVRLSSFMSFSTEIYVIQGDSNINTLNYKKIWMTYDSTLLGLMYQGLVREENNVVYYVPPNYTEGILYDFNLEVGDTAYVKNMFCGDVELEVVVTAIDTVEYFGVERKRWLIDDQWSEYWVEGIGSLNGPLHTMYYYWIVCPVWELLCYHENDTLLYILPGEDDCFQTTVGIESMIFQEDFKVMPNPVSQGQPFEIQTSHDIKSASIFNASGVLVKHVFPVSIQRITVETTQMKPGLYLIKIETRSGKMKTAKLLVL